MFLSIRKSREPPAAAPFRADVYSQYNDDGEENKLETDEEPDDLGCRAWCTLTRVRRVGGGAGEFVVEGEWARLMVMVGT